MYCREQSLHQQTPLHIAVKQFRVKTVECLVDKGADINSKDNAGVSMCDYLPMIYFYSVACVLSWEDFQAP